MLPERKKNALIGILGGIGVAFISGLLTPQGDTMAMVGGLLMVIAIAMNIWGFINVAIGKGHSWTMGLLVFIPCIGWIIVLLLPDKTKTG